MKAHPAPFQTTGVAERWLRHRRSGADPGLDPGEERGIHSRETRRWNTDRATMRGSWLWIPGSGLRRPGNDARCLQTALFSSTFLAYISSAVRKAGYGDKRASE